MIARVTVVCDNPQHAGKVAKVSTFLVDTDAPTVIRDNGRKRSYRRVQRHRDRISTMSVASVKYRDKSVPACNLCGRSLPDDPRVYRAVVRLATQPEQNASLSDIAASIQLEA